MPLSPFAASSVDRRTGQQYRITAAKLITTGYQVVNPRFESQVLTGSFANQPGMCSFGRIAAPHGNRPTLTDFSAFIVFTSTTVTSPETPLVV